jgi:hypothetical protein
MLITPSEAERLGEPLSEAERLGEPLSEAERLGELPVKRSDWGCREVAHHISTTTRRVESPKFNPPG